MHKHSEATNEAKELNITKPRNKTKHNEGNYKKKEKYTFSRALSAKYYSRLSRKRNGIS